MIAQDSRGSSQPSAHEQYFILAGEFDACNASQMRCQRQDRDQYECYIEGCENAFHAITLIHQ
jgi:hypothetical protein